MARKEPGGSGGTGPLGAHGGTIRQVEWPGTGPGRGSQLLDPLLVTLLAGGGLGLQQGLGVLQPGQPLGPAGQRPRQFVAAASAVLAVFCLVDDSCLLEQLGNLGLEVGVGAVGRRGGVGLDLGPVERDESQADHAGGCAQLQRLDQQAGQGLFVADPEPGDGHVIGRAVAGQDAEGDVLVAAAFDLAGRADPGAVAIQQHSQQHPGLIGGPAMPIGPIGGQERAKVELVDHVQTNQAR